MAAPAQNRPKVFPYKPESEFILAVRSGAADKVATLLAQKVNPNSLAKDHTPAIMVAASLKSTRVAELLLNTKADINAQGRHGNTALHDAAMLSNQVMIDFLLGRGADSKIRNHAGLTYLEALRDFKSAAAVLFLQVDGSVVNLDALGATGLSLNEVSLSIGTESKGN